MLGLLLPVEENTTHEEINIWLVPMMALWANRPNWGLLNKVMIFLLSEVAKYHKDFDFGPHITFFYK